MRRFTPFLHRAAGRHAKRIRAAEKTQDQVQLPFSDCILIDQDSGHLLQQLQPSRPAQHSGSLFQGLWSQQRGYLQHCSAASVCLSWVLSCQIRSGYLPASARHLSASAKGPREGRFGAGQPPRQAMPVQQPAGHSRVRQPQNTSQQTSAYAQPGRSEGGSPHQSRPVTAFAPGAQRSQQDPLDWGGGASSKASPQGVSPEGDVDVRVVSEDKTHRVMPMSAALKLAKRERMDLLPVAPNARPPVFRLGDANEAAKQARLRERDMRRKEMENRRKTLMKEVKIGPNTQENDLKMKLDKARDMVSKLYRVRIFIPYRMKDREAAVRMLQRLREICTDFANVAGPEGIEKLPANTVVVYLSPKT